MSVQELMGAIPSLDTPEWWPDGTPPMPNRELSGPHVWFGEDMAKTDAISVRHVHKTAKVTCSATFGIWAMTSRTRGIAATKPG